MPGWFCQRAAAVVVLFAMHSSAHLLLPRKNTTATATSPVPSGRISCPGTDFTCPSNTRCIITVPDNSTLLCCLIGNDCSTIAPITCDIQQQNATAFPNSSLYTTQLDATLDSCGSGTCCPAGYSCGSDSMCALDPRSPTSTPSSTPSPTPSSTPSSTPNSTPTSQPTLTPSSASSSSVVTSATLSPTGSSVPTPESDGSVPQGSNEQANKFPPASIVLGLFLGLALGVAATVFIFWLMRRRRQQAAKRALPSPDFMGKTPPSTSPIMQPVNPTRPQHKPTGSGGSTVSEPMRATAFDGAHRSDFLRRGDSKTGYEHQMKPSWSSNDSAMTTITENSTAKIQLESATPVTVQRVRSTRINAKNASASATHSRDPHTPPDQGDTSSGRDPRLQDAARMGLPATPTPAQRSVRKPQRPPRSDEFVPTMSGGLASSYEGGSRVRGDSQTRLLVRHDVLARAQEEYARKAQAPQGIGRSHSAASGTSSIATHGSYADSMVSRGEVMTIHLDTPGRLTAAQLAPPAPLFATNDENGRPQTTFTDLMVRAGWKEGDGWHTTSVPNRR